MSLFDQAKLFEGSEQYPSDVFGLTSLPLDPNELSYDPVGSFLNPPTSSLDVSTLVGDSELYLDDGFDSLFEPDLNRKNDEVNLSLLSDDTLFDDPFELGYCAISESLPVTGKKSRLRRLDDSESCKDPTATPSSGVEPGPRWHQ